MSESTVESKTEVAKEGEEDVCKDFMRGRCERKFCKYKHEAIPKNLKLNFCHDFQNAICPRPNCKFIHCSPDEEEAFKKSGTMTNIILVEATRKNQIPGIQPVCNEFRKGTCRRTNCRYRHVTRKEEDAEILEFLQSNNHKTKFPRNDASDLRAFDRDIYSESNNLYDYGPKSIKRRLMSDENPNINEDERYYYEHPSSPGIRQYTDEDIANLQCEVASLKRQLQEATANNLFLSGENEALRMAAKRRMADSSTSLADQATASTQQVIGTVTAGVTSIPVSIATVPVSITTVPVSITTVTTGNPVTISAVPSVSIASTGQLLAQSPQILVTPSTQLAIANNSQAQLTIAASTAQQLAVANVSQQLTLTNQAPQQLALAGQNQQQITLTNPNQQQVTLTAPNQQQLTLTNQNHQQIAIVNQNQQQLTVPNQNPTQLTQVSLTSQQLSVANQNQQQGQQVLATQQLDNHQPIDLTIDHTMRRPIITYGMFTRGRIQY